MKKVLITGGAGFVGSEIIEQLYGRDDYSVTALDCLSEQIHGRNPEDSWLYNRIKDKCSFVRGDVRDSELLGDLLRDVDIVVHLASETGTGQSMYRLTRYSDINIMGTAALLQSLMDQGASRTVKKVILASSRAVYGEGKYKCRNCGTVFPHHRTKERMSMGDFGMYCDKCGTLMESVPTTEDSRLSPGSVYAYTKCAQESMTGIICDSLEIDYTILRFQNVYGIGQSLKNPYTGILAVFSSLMMENKPVNVFEDGKESRDFVNVSDAAAAVISSLDRPEANGEIINIGSGIATTVLEIAGILKYHYNSGSEINVTGDYRIGDIARNCADISKAGKLLGFEPSVTLEDGLNAFCEWVKDSEYDNSDYDNSLKEMEHTGLFMHSRHIDHEDRKTRRQ